MVLCSVEEWSSVKTIRTLGVLCSERTLSEEVCRAVLSELGIAPTILEAERLHDVDVLVVAEASLQMLCARIERVRLQGYTLPLMVVTTLDHPTAIERVFKAGADDFIKLPERIAELPHRLMAIRRRAFEQWTKESTRKAPKFTQGIGSEAVGSDFDCKAVSIEDERIVLTTRELALLRYLCARPGMWVSASELLAMVCDCPMQRDSTLVRVHMWSVRKKLGVFANLLESRRTYGYRWVGSPDSL